MPPTPTVPVPPVICQVPQAPNFPPSPNSKKIFVFLDGTGNEFVNHTDKDKANSNVVKLYTTLRIADDQIAYYHPGVGTMGDPNVRWRIPRYWSMIKGLAFGAGFKANVLDAYRFLMEVYNDGDQIYIFGFSRGAYTARALASLLHGYGLLCRGNEGHLLYTWRMMIDQLKNNREELKKAEGKRTKKNHHSIQRNDAYIQTFSRIVTIRFMGLWDTVSSVGWIYTPLILLDEAQNPIIQVGRHAVSIDERRAFYRDNIWGEPIEINHPEWPETLRKQGIQQDIAQLWFPGVHSDVGGSYAQAEAGPANVALKWMIDELQQHGAQLCQDRIAMVLGHPTGKLAADGAYPAPHPPDNKIHDSLGGISGLLWWILQLFPQQYYDKDSGIIQWRVPFGRYRSIPSGAYIDGSVTRRLQHTEQGQEPYVLHNLNPANLHPIERPVPETTANLSGAYVHKTPNGKASVPSDPTALRYLKLVFGWAYFDFFWVALIAIVVLVLAVISLILGAIRIGAVYLFELLHHCTCIHKFFLWFGHKFLWLYHWLLG